MIAVSLVHLALMTHFAAAHAGNLHFDFMVAKAEPAVEKVDFRESTLSEKLDLDIDSIDRPNTEFEAAIKEIRTLSSAIGNCVRPPKTSWETPNPRAYSYLPDWNKQFAFQLDDDGYGFTFGKQHFERPTCDSRLPNVCSTGLDLGMEINR
jgi:hypothetical protein